MKFSTIAITVITATLSLPGYALDSDDSLAYQVEVKRVPREGVVKIEMDAAQRAFRSAPAIFRKKNETKYSKRCDVSKEGTSIELGTVESGDVVEILPAASDKQSSLFNITWSHSEVIAMNKVLAVGGCEVEAPEVEVTTWHQTVSLEMGSLTLVGGQKARDSGRIELRVALLPVH